MAEMPAFMRSQFDFAGYIRNPQKNKLPVGIEPRRMALYRELFFNNIKNFLSDNFPVLKSCLGQKDWLALVEQFYAEHTSCTPHFCEIPEEFLYFLQHEREPQANDLAFMLELAHYEWVEMALAFKQTTNPLPTAEECLGSAEKFSMMHSVRLSELAWPLAYQFPVHQIDADNQPNLAPELPTCLIVYRNANEKVAFLAINTVTWRLVELIQQNPEQNPEQLFSQLAKELKQPFETILPHALNITKEMISRSILQLA